MVSPMFEYSTCVHSCLFVEAKQVESWLSDAVERVRANTEVVTLVHVYVVVWVVRAKFELDFVVLYAEDVPEGERCMVVPVAAGRGTRVVGVAVRLHGQR